MFLILTNDPLTIIMSVDTGPGTKIEFKNIMNSLNSLLLSRYSFGTRIKSGWPPGYIYSHEFWHRSLNATCIVNFSSLLLHALKTHGTNVGDMWYVDI